MSAYFAAKATTTKVSAHSLEFRWSDSRKIIFNPDNYIHRGCYKHHGFCKKAQKDGSHMAIYNADDTI